MMARRVCIIKHVEEEGPGRLSRFLEETRTPVATVDLSAGDRLPEDLDSLAGVIMMGGPMNVYEEEAYPFLKEEDGFIKRVLEEEIPFVGICLGAQLLAKACDAEVVRAPEKEVGWYTVSLTDNAWKDRLFRGLPRELTVFQWHGDTFGLPKGATLLASGSVCPNQAFRVSEFAYGLQFHPEVTPDLVDGWMREAGDGVDPAAIAAKGSRVKDVYETEMALLLLNVTRLIDASNRMRSIWQAYLGKGRPQSLFWSSEERTLIAG